MTNALLNRLRARDMADAIGPLKGRQANAVRDAFAHSGVKFAAASERMEARFYQAVRELIACIKPTIDDTPILNEGGIYSGCWLESTGTISAELLARFIPGVAQATFQGFAASQRSDGLFPYKLTTDGPVFAQIQLVSPLARSVWTHARINGADEAFLETMYAAMTRYDAWLARNRDTRGTGAVEAFCTFDTGHDLSARFWHVPDSPFGNDPGRHDPANPVLPFIAPDLTANVACQRLYLARIADALGKDGTIWQSKAERSFKALFDQCYDAADGFFYDRDRNDALVRVQSDVLLRVLSCEVGDAALFDSTLKCYLLNTRKFFAKYPFTSIALDDPRFDPAYDYNSWSGPSNLLSLIRAPHAFETHGRHVELTWVLQPILSALFRADRFAQTLHPFTGRPGFTEVYSPAILCCMDFVERLCGIQPRPDGHLWFTGLVPQQIEHRDTAHATAYGRTVNGHDFELVNTQGETVAWRDGDCLFRAPHGVRVITNREGTPISLVGMSATRISGTLETNDGTIAVEIRPNEQMDIVDGALETMREGGLVTPSY